ncbi:MAG: hypothetical protein JXR88_08775 [Clostridia bacterium]|nr:hypothetical protein [Clostridia bacterium]
MEAAKRMFDNSYNQRLETEALAKAYLDTPKEAMISVNENKRIKQIKNGRVCSIIGIISAMGYCLMIFSLLLMPLIKETEIHKMKVEIYQHEKEIKRLTYDINVCISEIQGKTDISYYETVAKEMGMVRKDPSMSIPAKDVPYVTLEEARNAYYNPTIDYMSQDEGTTVD